MPGLFLSSRQSAPLSPGPPRGWPAPAPQGRKSTVHDCRESAPAGTGIIAGGPIRSVCEVLGIQDVVAKSIGSSNPYNMVRATVKALSKINSPRQVAARRGKKVNEVISQRLNDGEVSA